MADLLNPHLPRRRRAMMWAVLCVAIPAGLVSAQSSGGNYTLRKSVIGAGIWAQGSPYRIEATAGQPSAGVATGGSYRVTAGFHRPSQPGGIDPLFCNGFDTSSCTSGVTP